MCSNNLKLPIRAAPYRHQREAAAFALDKLINGGGAALLMEMGTGKTLTTIAIVGRLWQEKRVQRLLVVAPLSILGVWEDEFRKFAGYDYSLAVLEGTGARKADTIRHMTGAALQVLVVNYESAWRLEKELAAWKPDCIVCDEGHKIKTHNIAASKALHRLGAKARYRLLLTGTVITNKPIDVFSQYKFADPTVFGSSFYLFRNRYFDMVGYGNHTPVMKKSMEAEFTEKLHSIAFRATKAECLDLPECTDIVQRVELEPAARRVYLQLVKDSYADLANGSVTVTNVLTRLGFTVVPFGQGYKDMSPPTKELMKLTLEGKLAHGGHPVLRWMVDNVTIRSDPAGNIKADKEKSTEKIDGAIATIMALDRAIRHEGDGASVYDERGLLFI